MEEQTVDVGERKSLVDWKNPPQLRNLKQDLEGAQPSHKSQVQKIKEWLDYLNVEGSAKFTPVKGNSGVQPRLIRKQAEWRYASLSLPFLSSPDLFDARPVTWEDRKAAQQNGIVLNHQFNTKLKKQKFIDEYVRTAVDEGTVIVKVCWDFEEGPVKRQQPIVEFHLDPSLQPLHAELAELKATDPTTYQRDVPEELQMAHDYSVQTGISYRPLVTGQKEIEEMKTLVNQPRLEICDYRNTIIDPSCMGDLEKAEFVITSFESSKSALKKDGKYKDIDSIQISNNSILGEPDHASENTTAFNLDDEARAKFVVYEYWGYWDIDGTGTTQPFVCAWVGDTVIRLEKSPYPDGKLPFVSEQYLPVRKKIYGEPDGELLIENQKIAGAVTRGMIDIMAKSANGQTGRRRDALDATNKRKYERGEDYEFNPNVHPEAAFYMHTYPEIPASAQIMLQQQNFEAEAMTGVKSFATGLSGDGFGEVAAGIRGALDAASKRELNILNRLKEGMVQIGRKIIAMNALFLDEQEVVRLTNEEFVTVLKDDLAGNIDLQLTISTAEEDNAKAQELSFMLQTIGPNEDPQVRRMVMADIARLRKMPDLAKKLEDYVPQPDPLQQKLQELEIAKLEYELAELQAKTVKLQTAAQLDMAKANTEQSKARQLNSDADMKDLDFVEQESGVTQERELQQHGAQARANMELELVKGVMKERTEAKKAQKA